MPRQRTIDLQFPLGGLNRRLAYQSQPPFTTPHALNVRPEGTLEKRMRGGSRPGLKKRFSDVLGSGNPIRLLEPLRTVPITQSLSTFTDTFPGTSLAGDWSLGSGLYAYTALPGVSDSYAVGSTVPNDVRGMYLDAQTMDVQRPFTLEAIVELVDYADYTLYAALDDTTPNRTQCLRVVFRLSGRSLDSSNANMSMYLDNAPLAGVGDFRITRPLGTLVRIALEVREDHTFRMYYNTTPYGSYQLGDATIRGTRVALELEYVTQQPRIDYVAYQYFSTAVSSYAPFITMAASNGQLYKEYTDGTMDAVGNTPPALASDKMLSATQRIGKLYVADDGKLVRTPDDQTAGNGKIDSGTPSKLDHNDESAWTGYGIEIDEAIVEVTNVTGASSLVYDGNTIANGGSFIAKIAVVHATDGLTLTGVTGLCTGCDYRVMRAPKVYDPPTDTLAIWWPEVDTDVDFDNELKGAIPIGATIVEVYKDCLVLTGDADHPGAWWLSRQGNPLDFDTSQLDGRASTSGAAANSDTGGLPQPITALAPIGDDYLVFASRNEMWVLRGHPLQGGLIDNISYVVGMVSHRAWCVTPEGRLVFLASDGLYTMTGGPTFDITPVSRDRIPQELVNIDPTMVSVSLAYDTESHGVLIFLTTVAGQGTHYFFHWPTQSFWQLGFAGDHQATSSVFSSRDSAVLMGCRDGYIRRFSDAQETDDGTTIDNEVWYGPIRLGGNNTHDGLLLKLDAVLDEQSGDVDWSVIPGATPEEALNAAAAASGTWSAGLNPSVYPRVGGHSAFLKLEANTTDAWAVDRITARLEQAGLQRVP